MDQAEHQATKWKRHVRPGWQDVHLWLQEQQAAGEVRVVVFTAARKEENDDAIRRLFEGIKINLPFA